MAAIASMRPFPDDARVVAPRRYDQSAQTGTATIRAPSLKVRGPVWNYHTTQSSHDPLPIQATPRRHGQAMPPT